MIDYHLVTIVVLAFWAIIVYVFSGDTGSIDLHGVIRLTAVDLKSIY